MRTLYIDIQDEAGVVKCREEDGAEPLLIDSISFHAYRRGDRSYLTAEVSISDRRGEDVLPAYDQIVVNGPVPVEKLHRRKVGAPPPAFDPKVYEAL